MKSIIAGIGLAAPRSTSQEEILRHATSRSCSTARQEQVLERTYHLTGINSRSTVFGGSDILTMDNFYNTPEPGAIDRGPTTGSRMRVYSEAITPLALEASKKALASASASHSSITHLITVSCTGFFAPGFDIQLIQQLSLNNDVARTHVGFMGCHGTLNALRIASSIVKSDPSARVLLCAAELCSIHFQYGWQTDRIVANSIFADGAGALIIANSQSAAKFTSGSPSQSSSKTAEIEANIAQPAICTVEGSGAYLIPNSLAAMTWRIEDSGFVMTLSAEVPLLIEQHLKKWLTSWLAKYDLQINDIASWAVHPGGPRILNAVAHALELDGTALKASREVFSSNGNMSSPTVLFVLDRLRKQQKQITPCVMLAFGPGLAIEAALLGSSFNSPSGEGFSAPLINTIYCSGSPMD